jgi:hypothetical protein
MANVARELLGVMNLSFSWVFTGAMLVLIPGEAPKTELTGTTEATANNRPILDGPKVAAIERPAKQLIQHTKLDSHKGRGVERPARRVVVDQTDRVSNAEEKSGTPVAPGLVGWHPTFGAACEAAGRSGKPVLLFQLLGRLDQEFC